MHIVEATLRQTWQRLFGPEITALFNGTPVPRNAAFVDKLLKFDVLVIAGEAKSHCVAWTIDDLLGDILQKAITVLIFRQEVLL